jgi:chromosome segregation ATPase
MLEGQLQAAKANTERAAREFQDAQGKLTEAAIRVASLESERDGLRIRAEVAEKDARELKAHTAKRAAGRKTRSASTDM